MVALPLALVSVALAIGPPRPLLRRPLAPIASALQQARLGAGLVAERSGGCDAAAGGWGRRWWRRVAGSSSAAICCWAAGVALRSGSALASGGGGSVAAALAKGRMEGGELAGRAALWMLLFSLAAVFAGAETAITTLWPWKVKQLASDEAEEEERTGRPGSRIFEKLQGDITRVLTTVLVGVTICTIYGTALATDVAVQVWGQAGVGYATTLLTLMTLFFGELVPKSLAVANAEAVARATLPLIHWFSFLLYPLGRVMSGGTRLMLSLLGVTASEDGEAVSEPELRMMLLNAKQSGAVELYEKDMIEGVLDLDQATVEQIMQPRVEVVGIEVGDSLRGGSQPPPDACSTPTASSGSQPPPDARALQPSAEPLSLLAPSPQACSQSRRRTSTRASPSTTAPSTRSRRVARRPTSGRGPRSPLKHRLRLQVVGVALTRELIDYVDRPGADLSTLPASSLMEDIVYVPETMSAMNALKLMRQTSKAEGHSQDDAQE